jgi:hypothetical protein
MTQYSKNNIIERIAFLRKVKSLQNQGLNYPQIGTELGITYHKAQGAAEAYVKSIANILIVESLNDAQIQLALRNYEKGVAGSDLIDGYILDGNSALYFKALHIKDEHEVARNRVNVKKHSLRCKNNFAKIATQEMPTDKPTPEPIKELWDFSDENIVETKRPALVQFHGKSSGLGYGCAANMCANG